MTDLRYFVDHTLSDPDGTICDIVRDRVLATPLTAGAEDLLKINNGDVPTSGGAV